MGNAKQNAKLKSQNSKPMKKFLVRIWPYLVIVTIWFIFSSPYFFKGLVPFPSRYLVTFFPPWSAQYGMPVKNNAMPDVITQIYPWKKLTIESWKRGEIPLWNPYSFSGTPHAANYQTAVFSPINLLYFVLPFLDAWSISILLQPLLAGFFMYFLLRCLVRSQEASLIGAIAFMFCGFMVVWMAYGTLAYAAIWFPLALTSVFRQCKKYSWWNDILLSVSIGLSFLSGHFQISVYVLGLTLFVICWKTIESRRVSIGLHLLFFTFVGLILASPQLSLSYDAYAASVRGANVTKGEIIPWQYIATFFAPDFYGNPVTRNDWYGHYAEWAGFIGVVPLILFLTIIFRKKTKDEWLFLSVALFSLLLSYNTIFSDMLFRLKIPVLSTSAASRVIVITSFSLTVLASFGFDYLRKDVTKRAWILLSKTSLLVGFIIIALWLVAYKIKPFPQEWQIIAQRNIILPSLVGVIGIGILYIGRMNKHITKIAPYLLILIVVFDGYRFASKWMPLDERQFVYPQTETLAYLQKIIGIDRMFGNTGGEVANYFSLGSIEGYDALYQERYGRFISASSTGKISYAGRSVVLLGKSGTNTQTVLDILGVRYVLHRKSDGRNVWAYPVWNYPQYRFIYEDEYYEVFENTGAIPRATLVSSYQVKTDEQEIIDTLFSENFDKKTSVVLENKPDIEPAQGAGEVTIATYFPTRIELTTHADTPKLLVLTDVYDPGWRAYVDNRETAVLRANYDFRAVSVPSGSHTVTFLYRPKGFQVALVAASLVLLVLGIGTIKKIYENRHI